MSARSQTRVLLAAGIIGIGALLATLLPMRAFTTATGPRTLTLVVRDMTFYMEGNPEPNPTIVLKAGEWVKLHLRNEDAGMRHDFAVKAWDITTRILEDRGEEDTISFRVPDTTGTTPYICTPHAKMMSGTLRVE
jgi:plastocyanin